MTGLQPLEPTALIQAIKFGHVKRREFEYIRHGTKALIAAFDIATGKVRGSSGDSRTEADFVALLDDLFAADPAARWKVVLDNLNTHTSEGMVRLVPDRRGINEELGEKGKSASSSQWRHAKRS